jgi:hypothetical protein
LAAEKQPHLVWNAFIDLIAVEKYEDLSTTHGIERLRETISALHELGLPCHGRVLERVAQAFAAAPQGAAWEIVLGDDAIEQLDTAFHACRPDVDWGLKRHLGLHQEEYVSKAGTSDGALPLISGRT